MSVPRDILTSYDLPEEDYVDLAEHKCRYWHSAVRKLYAHNVLKFKFVHSYIKVVGMVPQIHC